jgi:hypothetical protein
MPAKTFRATIVHVVPPSLETRIPWPRWKYSESPSPVPANTVEASEGSNASAPTASVGWSSVRAVQLVPPSTVSQIPPAALPTKT